MNVSHGTSADLEMSVRTRRSKGGHFFEFELHSPNRVAKFHRTKFRSDRLHKPKRFQEEILNRLEMLGQITTSGRKPTSDDVAKDLADIGTNLYDDLFPSQLKEEYWTFHSSVQTLLLTSDEPWIPWELVKPYRDGEPGDFLCLQFAMSRWLAGEGPVQDLRIRTVAVIAVEQPLGWSLPKLTQVVREREVLTRLTEEEGVQLIGRPKTYKEVKDLLEGGGADLLHFACHGDFAGQTAESSELHLADDSLRPRDLTGATATKLRQIRPMVFLNACRTAGQGWSLTGLEGWAHRWIERCGCGAFVAPLWAVDDKRACEFAELFYEEIRKKRNLGKAVQIVRNRLYKQAPHDPSWLAYCLYGDPNAEIVFEISTDAEDKKEREVGRLTQDAEGESSGEATGAVPARSEAARETGEPVPETPEDDQKEALIDVQDSSVVRPPIWRVLALLAFLLAVVLAVTVWWPRPRPAVAVLGVETQHQPEYHAWRSTAIAEILDAHLTAGDEIWTIDREQIATAERARRLLEATTEKEKRDFWAANLGADYLVRGFYEENTDGQLEVRFELQWVATGQMRNIGPHVVKSDDDLFEVACSAATGIRRALRVGRITSEQQRMLKDAFPASMRFYSMGIEAYRSFEFDGARKQFQKAKVDGEHPLVSLALARSLVELTLYHEALEELDEARDRFEKLPRKFQIEAETDLLALKEDWIKGAEIYSVNYKKFPEEIDYCIENARLLLHADEIENAQTVLKKCRRNAKTIFGSAWVDFLEADVYLRRGELGRAQELARQAADQSKKWGWLYLEATARLDEAALASRLGDVEAAEQARQEVKKLPLRSRRELLNERLERAYLLSDKERYEAAKTVLESCLDVYRWQGDFLEAARMGIPLATVLNRLGEVDRAAEILCDVRAQLDAHGDRYAAATAATNLGAIYHDRGRLGDAWDAYEYAASIFTEEEDQKDFATALANLGEVLFASGLLDEPRRLYNWALDIHRGSDNTDNGDKVESFDVAYDLFRLGEVEAAEGAIAEAERLLERALLVMKQDERQSGEAYLSLARLEFFRGNYATASEKAELARKQLKAANKRRNNFEAAEESELAMLARIVQARALWKLPSVQSAEGAYADIHPELPDYNDPRIDLEAALLKVNRQQAKGEPLTRPILEELAVAAKVAAAAGWVRWICEARWELSHLASPELSELRQMIEKKQAEWQPKARRVLESLNIPTRPPRHAGTCLSDSPEK